MSHYKSMYDDNGMLYAHDLAGKEFVLVIKHVAAGSVTGKKGRKAKKPIVTFANAKKQFALNKTNGKTIASLYGTDTTAWSGKSVTLYPAVTEMDGEQVECIRIKPSVPTRAASKESPEAKEPPPIDAEEAAQIARNETDQ